uniref:WRKY19-like zinc finger domain-containing protein n=1 Tax=Oryza nivara TaxID=4536 RepID=A0A0E0GB19_ORYNI
MDKASCGLGFGDSINSLDTSRHWSTVQHTSGLKATTIDYSTYSSFSIASSKTLKRKRSAMAGPEGTGNPLLTLGLGHSPSSSDNSKVSSATAYAMSPSSLKEADEESSADLGLNFELCLGNDMVHCQKKSPVGAENSPLTNSHKLDLQLSLSTGSPESAVTNTNMLSPIIHGGLEIPVTNCSPAIIGEGSVPCTWVFEKSVISSSYASEATYTFPFSKVPKTGDAAMSSPVISSTLVTSMKSPVACTSGSINPQQRNSITKNCQFPGCVKGARGASGHCIAHGGGRRCQKPGCQKGAEGRTIYCKAHGGGRRCQFLGCTKSAEGRTDHCIAHGGGRRCSHDGCSRAARGKSGLCIRHGGGKRCQKENCIRSAEGHSGFCISHGGGRRCQFPECTKGAQGSTKFCKAHGGGKRCTFSGCNKGAEGSTLFCKGHGGGKRCLFQGGGVCPKSVHGGTQYCVAHGGGKRCAISGCTKSARGRTEYCVRHGGGKRCKFEGCAKSAQGSTDFCKAHGGGKRCSWGQVDSNFGVGAPQCDKFARSKTGLCSAHCALVLDHCVRGGTLGAATFQFATDAKFDEMEVTPVKGDPHAQASSDDQSHLGGAHPPAVPAITSDRFSEGRVHGGGLLALLSRGGNHANAGNSKNGPSTMMTWE